MKEKKSSAEKLSGKSGFEKFYSEIYGERWENLKASFSQEKRSTEYYVPGAEKSYFLDSASVMAALSLPLGDEEQKILDLCAAPGGKTVVLASRMSDSSVLFANERSLDRKKRLSATVLECLPKEISCRVEVSCSDGALWCKKETECFDRILLDAPCSSERHVYNDEKYLKIWTSSRIKQVTSQQWALLSCAYRLLKKGGVMVYSTCALCPQENDGMIERLQKKFSDENPFELLEPCFDKNEICNFIKGDFVLTEFEKTEYGFQIMPDSSAGAGPIYFSVIKKQM